MANEIRIAKAKAEQRLMDIAFEFQTALLNLAHDLEPFTASYTPETAERLADEIQFLSHFFEPEGKGDL